MKKVKIKIKRPPNANYKKGQVVTVSEQIAQHYLSNGFATEELTAEETKAKGGCSDCQSKEEALQAELDAANLEIGTLTESNQELVVKLAASEAEGVELAKKTGKKDK